MSKPIEHKEASLGQARQPQKPKSGEWVYFIKHPFQWVLSWLEYWLFTRAKKKAIRLHELTNLEYRVFAVSNGYITLHSSQVKRLAREGKLPFKGGYVEMDKYCVYTTLQLKKTKSHKHDKSNSSSNHMARGSDHKRNSNRSNNRRAASKRVSKQSK